MENNLQVIPSAPKDLTLVMEEKFKPFEDQAAEWMAKAKELVVTDVSQVEEMQKAREARLALKNIRVQVEKLHKSEKEDYLRAGKTIDAIKNKLVALIQPIEAHLQEQEDFVAIQEENARKELYASRLKQLEPYRMPMDGLQNVPFGEMHEDAFNTLLLGLQAGKEARERKAEEEKRQREEDERKAREERERVKRENDKLQKINARGKRITALGLQWDESEKGYVFECYNGHTLKIDEVETTEDSIFETQMIELTKFVESDRAHRKRQADDLAAKLKQEQEARKKLEDEKRAAEEKAEAERKRLAAEKRKAARAPDKVKLLNFAERISLIEPITINSDEARDIYDKASRDLQNVITYLKIEAEKL